MNHKYKAWDKSDKRMITHKQDFIPLIVTNFGVMRLSPKHENNLYSIVDVERFELMQYTGLKDKNDKEIYFDCEIFRFKVITSIDGYDQLIGIMTYNDEELRAEIDIYPENNKEGYVCLSYQPNIQMYDFEIIGTKYENPELLNNN